MNLNTDELETKLDDVINAINTLGTKLDIISTKQDEIKTLSDSINNKINPNFIALLNKFAFLNPSHVIPVPEGDTTFDNNSVLCNITEDNITVTVIPADGGTNERSVVLTPGWNPIVVKSIKGATANTLLYGY